MDDFDLKIADILDRKGRSSYRKIGEELGVSEATIRRRLGNMTENGSVKFPAVLDIEEFPEIYIAIVGIVINVNPNKCIQKILELPSVLYTMTVTGRYDIIAIIIYNSRKMFSITSTGIIDIDGVVHLETFIVIENYGLKIPASKLFDLKSTLKSIEND